ncbi:hypothetical protein M885DRAFT_588904 [Pelagophyceae sp. CCMP2097]|nr:hypothetical protein M885DRAFT_588904 [Pelagophyceae sp. CCMP2097]
MVLDALEGDGVSDLLLQLLHKRDELNYGPTIYVPDTVVYKFGQPVHWYFTGVDGKLKKKNKSNLVNVRIEEALTKGPVCDVVAYYISEEAAEDSETATHIEYLDRKGLHDFLYSRFKQNNGMLQKFIEPKGTSNAVVRAIWSPKVCLLERRVNGKALHDARFGLYERAVTYEGPEHFSAAAPLRGNLLPSRIQRLCETVVTHVAEVSFQKLHVCRMVANFKVDAKDRIWFLWTTSIRLEGNGRRNVVKDVVNIGAVLKIPPHVKLTDTANHSFAAAPALEASDCLSCGSTQTSDKFHPVQYKTLIRHFDLLMSILKSDGRATRRSKGTFAETSPSTCGSTLASELTWPPDKLVIAAAGGVGFSTVKVDSQDHQPAPVKEIDLAVPPVLRALHPRLTLEYYTKYKRDPLFLYKTVDVCETCFLVYAELQQNPLPRPQPRRQHRILDNGEHVPPPRSTEAWQPAVASKPRSRADASSTGTSRRFTTHAAPSMPAPIFSAEAFETPGSTFGGEAFEDSLSIEEMVRRREEAFFRECAGEAEDGAALRGHPLAHLVTTFRALQEHSERVNDQTSALSQPRSLKALPRTGSLAGASPYNCKPVLYDLPGRGPSRGLQASASAHLSKSSNRHRNFLMQTLEDVQSSLQEPQARDN